MRGELKNKIIFFLFGILFMSSLCNQMVFAKVNKKPVHKTTLIIGDSIPYGMALGKKAILG